MVTEEVAILLDGEELPTNEKIRYLTVEILSQEERNQIKDLQEKVEKLVESGALSHEVAARLDLVFASLEKIAERVDAIKKPYDLDIVIDDVKDKMSSMMQELEALSSSVSRKLDSSLQRFETKSVSINEAASSIASIKNDMQSVFSDLESQSKSMESRLGGLGDNLRNFLSIFDKRLDDLGRTSGSLEVMKEEVEMSIGNATDKMQAEIESLSGVVSGFGDVKNEIAVMNDSTKESNIKLSILIDSIEQKVFELTTIFDNVKNIETSIASQTNSLKNIVDFMKEFIEHAQESSVKLDNAVIDFGAFRDRVNDEMKKVLDLVDERTSSIDITSRELSGLKSQLEAKFEDINSIKADLSEAVYNINKNSPLMEKAAADILDVHSLISTSAERLESSMEDLRKMAEQSEGFISNQLSVAAELKAAGSAAEKTIKSMKAVQEQLETTSKGVDRKTDDILNVLFKKVGQLEKANDSIEKNSDSILSASNKLENIVDRLSSLPHVRAARRKKKPKPSKKSRRIVRRRRTRSVRRISGRAIENEALDLLVVDTLKNVSMNMASLETATKVSETRLRKRLNVLITRGVIAKEKRGRSIYYVSRVEQATEEDN